MRQVKDKLAACTLAVALCLGITAMPGCGKGGSGDATPGSAQSAETASSENSDVATYADIDAMDFEYTDRDKHDTYDEGSATKIHLEGDSARVDGNGAEADGSQVVISDEGTYVVSGKLADGQLAVDTDSSSKVQLVFDNVDIHNENGAALYVKQADKCFVTLKAGTQNILSDGAEYIFDEGEDEPNATLFSKDDLTINGSGTLKVTGSYKHGIYSKDDLVITGGAIEVESKEDGIRGKDSVRILDGAFLLSSGEDAIKSSRDDDPAKGYVSIDGGSYTINAGDDAVHGETYLRLTGGSVDVEGCVEGFEAMVISIDDGNVSIISSDDALNASAPGSSSGGSGFGLDDVRNPDAPDGFGRGKMGSTGPMGDSPQDGMGRDNGIQGPSASDGSRHPGFSEGAKPPNQHDSSMSAPVAGRAGGPNDDLDANGNCKLTINGGTITLNAQGDAIDSNGSVEINGGAVFVSGPAGRGNGALDYNLTAECNGGIILIVGSDSMAQGFNGGSQPSIFSTSVSGQAGQKISVVSPEGSELASFMPAKQFSMVLASAPGMQAGGTYDIVIDGKVAASLQAR